MSAQRTLPTSLPKPEGAAARVFIVLMALLQGLLLYLADQAEPLQWWWLLQPGMRTAWTTLALAVPAVLILSVIRLADWRLWQHAALVAALLTPGLLWAAWSITGAEHLLRGAVLGPYGAAMALALFVALPYLQCRTESGSWRAPYTRLFAWVWHNTLSLLLAAVFTLVCWLVLLLWALLFEMIGVGFFRTLFETTAFRYLATGTMVGLGLLIGRLLPEALQVARQVLLGIFTGLLPLLAAVALLFALLLPFAGLAVLREAEGIAMTLMVTVALAVLFTNAVMQDGQRGSPYPAWLRWLVSAGLVAMPVCALLALWAIASRIETFGWTASRIYAIAAGTVLLAYALCYAIAALQRRGPWLSSLAPINVTLSLLLIGLLLALHSPLLDPHRMGAANQMARWVDGRTDPAALDLEYLRFGSGRQGYRAAEALQQDARLQEDPWLRDELDAVLAANRPRGRATVAYERQYSDRERRAVDDAAALSERIRPAAGSDMPDDGFLQAVLATDPAHAAACRQPEDDCIVVLRDFDNSGRDDALLCRAVAPAPRDVRCLECLLWVDAADGWSIAGAVPWHIADEARCLRAQDRLRRGELQLRTQRWPGLELGDESAAVRAGPEALEPWRRER